MLPLSYYNYKNSLQYEFPPILTIHDHDDEDDAWSSLLHSHSKMNLSSIASSLHQLSGIGVSDQWNATIITTNQNYMYSFNQMLHLFLFYQVWVNRSKWIQHFSQHGLVVDHYKIELHI